MGKLRTEKLTSTSYEQGISCEQLLREQYARYRSLKKSYAVACCAAQPLEVCSMPAFHEHRGGVVLRNVQKYTYVVSRSEQGINTAYAMLPHC